MLGCKSKDTDIITILLSLFTTLLSTHTTIPSPSPTPSPPDDDDGKCELIGTFSLITQAFLGLLCLSSLIVKRFYEYPIRRTWQVWSFDVSKQLIGAFGVHMFNVILSVVKTAPDEDDGSGATRKLFVRLVSNGGNVGGGDDDSTQDPCDWYFLSIVFDCTIGVYILYLVFKAFNKILRKHFHITQIESGEYGPDPNKPSFKAFFKQLGVYFISLMITKVILYGIVECFEQELLWITSHVLLVWLDQYPEEIEIFMVMFVVPIVMNCLQLVLIDNFIRNQLWSNTNKRIKIEHPNFQDDTESVLRREIEEILHDEQDHVRKFYGELENGNISLITDTTTSNANSTTSSRKNYGSVSN
ncbi:uncharacterized protein J8A68_002714 [[Candida] subhashii]|uniref:Vacuolar membrane protein n=1 Tax=[Candida] subhashii TaxID=561895 RepID=A0A8J5UPR6_9ASCO|nr:uncharacterized protein J8A68_002714 [[Candida] subhashii]KAG7663767.1 hypothetical protein J8A68_002714 [[Candida] subhashii]